MFKFLIDKLREKIILELIKLYKKFCTTTFVIETVLIIKIILYKKDINKR